MSQLTEKYDNTYDNILSNNVIDYNNLKNFIKQYKLTDSNENANITSNLGRFYIPNEKVRIKKFFELLENCLTKNKLLLHFREIQTNDVENNVGSGIMFDFDLYDDVDIFTNKNYDFTMLIQSILLIMTGFISIDESITSHAVVINKPETTFDNVKNKYKYGFHILIPGIKLLRNTKKFIYSKIMQNKNFKTIFEGLFNCELTNQSFDSACTSVPVYFLFNCKETAKVAYSVHSYFEYNIIKYQEEADEINISVIKRTYEEIFGNNNINQLLEFSLNFDGDFIVKNFYKLKDKYISNQIDERQIIIKPEDEITKYEEEYELYKELSKKNIEFIKQLILEVLNIERATDYVMWRNVIMMIANIEPNRHICYRSIAHLFSYRCREKYNEESLNTFWDSIIESDTPAKLTIGSLFHWCITDNNDLFTTLKEGTIDNLIKNEIFNRNDRLVNGELDDYHCAKYIKYLFDKKFITCGENDRDLWYEFITKDDDHDNGQLYKWINVGGFPIKLINYLTENLPAVINRVIIEAEEYAERQGNDGVTEFIAGRTSNLIKTARKQLYKTQSKKNILKETAVLLRVHNLSNKFDKDDNILGVANGVLELYPEVRLIESYHDYLITMSSPVKYIEYSKIPQEDIDNLLNCIYTLFPDDEKDAFHYMMYYFATSLDGRSKDSMILILTGVGSNGKSFISQLFQTIMGDYGKSLQLGFITESRSRSGNANPSLMELEHARIAYFAESDKNESLNTSTIKGLTGNENVSGRQLYKTQKSFKPKCNYMITTNNKFSIPATDDGTWRRIYTYNMPMKFTKRPKEGDKYERKINTKIGKEYVNDPKIQQTFLSMVVEYYKDLQNRFNGELINIVSPTIFRQSQEYRNEEDTLNKFIDSHIVYNENGPNIPINRIADLYAEWYAKMIDSKISMPKKNVLSDVKNSKLSCYYKMTDVSTEVFEHIRILFNPATEKLNEGEIYIKDMPRHQKKLTTIDDYRIENFNPLNL